MDKFKVATGIVIFNVEALSPRLAIEVLKHRIDSRRHRHFDPEIGMSLVHSLDAGKLYFLVMSEDGKQVLGAEVNGKFRAPVSRELATAFAETLTDEQYWSLPMSGEPSDVVYPPYMSQQTYELLFPKRCIGRLYDCPTE